MYYKTLLISLVVMISCKNAQKDLDITQEVVTDSLNLNEDSKEENIPEKEHASWSKNAVIYEINVRQYSKKGNLQAVTNDLNRIKDLGVDVLWLMPIQPIGQKNRKGKLGSYYAVKDYKSINPEFGDMQDFKALVDSAHSLHMKVIIDWVANHTSPDHVWVKEHLEYYTQDSLGNAPIPTPDTDWTDVADLNYDNPALRTAMIDAMKYWITETDIDGFRCDIAELVPLDFWIEARKDLESNKPLFMLAEGDKTELFEAFDMIYGWKFKNTILDVADTKKNLAAIPAYINQKKKPSQPNGIVMYFTTNHDENSWNYIEREKFGANMKNYQALTYFMGGMPLIYNGQESGLNKQLAFFEKDSIDWGSYNQTDFYKNMNQILKSHEVLWNNQPATFEILAAENEALNFIMTKDDKHLAILQNYSGHPKYVSKISLTGLNLDKNLLPHPDYKVSEKGVEVPPHSTVILGQ